VAASLLILGINKYVCGFYKVLIPLRIDWLGGTLKKKKKKRKKKIILV
jgi:hypothetical protein